MAAPEAKQHKAADQPTEMREVGHALLGPGYAEEKLENGVHDHEYARRHWNRREEQHDAVTRKIDRIGEEQPEHPARRADRRIDGAHQRRHRELREGGRDHADEAVDEIPPRADPSGHSANGTTTAGTAICSRYTATFAAMSASVTGGIRYGKCCIRRS